jgi:sulfonate transport system substrate-binding protein
VGIPDEVAREWFGRARTQFVVIDERVVADQQRTIDTYARHGVIQKRVAAADAFDLSFNPIVAPYAAASG